MRHTPWKNSVPPTAKQHREITTFAVFGGNLSKQRQIFNSYSGVIPNRRIFVYTFCLINICLSLSDDANKIKTLNIERA